jgi:hypothetical protein
MKNVFESIEIQEMYTLQIVMWFIILYYIIFLIILLVKAHLYNRDKIYIKARWLNS